MTQTVPEKTTSFAAIEEAIEDIRQGKFVVVVDAADRENEGDLTIAAQFATPEAINFMATHARGLICLCLTEDRCDELALRQMAENNEAPLQTAFTVSIEAREGVTTGHLRAGPLGHDPGRDRSRRRARTTSSSPATSSRSARATGASSSAPARQRRPSTSPGSPGLNPAGVVCEVMKEDGTMARVPDLVEYCEQHGVKLVTVADLIEYRRRTEKLDRAHGGGSPADGSRRVHGDRVPGEAHGQAPRRARPRRGRRRRERARPRALRVPDRRRLPLAAL